MADLFSYEGMRRRVRELEAERGGMLNIIAALVRQAGGRAVITFDELARDDTGVKVARGTDGGLILGASTHGSQLAVRVGASAGLRPVRAGNLSPCVHESAPRALV